LELSEEYAINGGQADCDSSNCAESCRLRHIVIKSDSAYVVNSMTSHVHKWQVNGWMTAKKTPVSNKDVFEALLEKIEEFETQHLTAVDFWLVPRAQNTEADELANQSLSLSAWFDY
jgi:ribonuclease HI